MDEKKHNQSESHIVADRIVVSKIPLSTISNYLGHHHIVPLSNNNPGGHVNQSMIITSKEFPVNNDDLTTIQHGKLDFNNNPNQQYMKNYFLHFNSNRHLYRDDHHHSHDHKLDSFPRSFNEMTKSLREAHGGHHGIVHKINYKHYAIMAFFFVLLIWSMIWLLHHDSHRCTVDQHTVDACLRRFVFFSSDEGQHFPRTDKQLDHYCREKTKSIQCLRHFVEGCLQVDRQQQKYFKKYVLSYKNQLDKTCLHRAERQKFIHYSDCLSESDLLKNATQCNEAFQNQLMYIAQNVNKKQKIPAACCALHQRNQCLDEKIQIGCKDEVKIFVMDHIEGPFRAIVQSLCTPEHSTSNGCQKSFDPSLWNKVFEHPESLVRQYSWLENELNSTVPLSFNNSTSKEQQGNMTNLRFKIVQLKFFEIFLSFFLILSN